MLWIVLGLSVLEATIAQNATACPNSTCNNGTSTCRLNPDGSQNCICYFGYRGPTCSDDFDECRMGRVSPCRTTGLCVNALGNYSCTCLNGWMGHHCETRDLSKPAECLSGWKGPNCTDDIDECTELSTDPCSPNGNCKNEDGSYSCNCNLGWQGQNCTDDIDECIRNPCQNGGQCSNLNGSYSCACASPWFGGNCSQSQCSSPCQHGGVCLNGGTSSFSCTCSTPWAGRMCEINTTCSHNPCENSGTCSNATGSFSCSCPAHWSGITCNINSTSTTLGDDDPPSLGIVIGATVGAVALVCGISGGAALIWYLTRGRPRRIIPDTQVTPRVTVVEVEQTSSVPGDDKVGRSGTTTEVQDIVMRTKFSLRKIAS